LGEDADDLQSVRPLRLNSKSIQLDGTLCDFGKRLFEHRSALGVRDQLFKLGCGAV